MWGFGLRPILQALEKKVAKKTRKNGLRCNPYIVAGYGRNGRKKFWGNVFALYFPFLRGISKKMNIRRKFAFLPKNHQNWLKIVMFC